MDFQCDLLKEAAADFKDNNLVNACLLQFPFGRGGMHELRKRGDGSLTNKMPIEDYVEHLSRVSQPHFHHELFTLILYNISMKQAMVKNAGWKVREKGNAAMFAKELTAEDVNEAIGRKQSGHLASNSGAGGQFLSAIDAVSRAVPHTNEAAKRARQDGEAHQHQFGLSHYFLTVTPYDDNSYLVQVYSNHNIDDDTPVSSLSDEELQQRAKLRTELRIQHPGICAYFYELMMDILLEEVIGWDMKKRQPRPQGGLLGIPQAFTATTEEQGRTTLHTHFQVWVEEFSEIREKLFSNNQRERCSAEQQMVDAVDRVSSCKFYDSKKCPQANNSVQAFPHNCKKSSRKRKLPVVVSDQELRALRHEKGIEEKRGRFADCPHCTFSWTNEELIESYLVCGVKVPGLTEYPDQRTKRLKAMAIEYQKSPHGSPEMNSVIVDAAYNHHIHAPSSCFGKRKRETTDSKSKKSEQNKNSECRYRHPQRKKRKTVIQDAGDAVQWYLWNGTFNERTIKEVCLKRHSFDAFQNVSCPAISQSKMTCNTNMSGVMPGPVGQYSFKYSLKSTQKDDTEEYERVRQVTEKILSKLQKDASDCSAAVS